MCLDAPLTLGMSTNENVDLLFPCDDIISIYLQETLRERRENGLNLWQMSY